MSTRVQRTRTPGNFGIVFGRNSISFLVKKTFLDRHLCYFCGHCLFEIIFVGLLLVKVLVLEYDVNFPNPGSTILSHVNFKARDITKYRIKIKQDFNRTDLKRNTDSESCLRLMQA